MLEGWPRSTDASLMPTRHLTETRIGSRGTPCGSLPISPMLFPPFCVHSCPTCLQFATNNVTLLERLNTPCATRAGLGWAGLPCADQRDHEQRPDHHFTYDLSVDREAVGRNWFRWSPQGAHHSANIH